MKLAHLSFLEDFGSRSLLLHGIMGITFVNAVLVGLLVGDELGEPLFLALLALTSGLWLSHTVHSLGTVVADGEYEGVLNELFDTGSAGSGFDVGRFARLVSLVAVVTVISLLTSAQRLSSPAFSVVAVLVGVIALVTAIAGFLIALGASYDAGQPQPDETPPS